MAESQSTIKGTLRKRKDNQTTKSLLNQTSLTSGRLSLMSNARLHRITSTSSERLSFISKKDEYNDLENYYTEYSAYLLSKVQSLVLTKNKQQKEDNLKKCFVSLKLELEERLDKYVKLSKDIGYFKTFLEVIKECNQKIEHGNKLLKVLTDCEFEDILKSLSSSLDQTTNQLKLVDIDKNIIDEAFSNNIWGSNSKIEECLQKTDTIISKNKEEIDKIADELVEIKKLLSENTILREKFQSVVEKASNDILETYNEVFTNVVKKGFSEREEYKTDTIPLGLNCDLGFLQGSNTKRFSCMSEFGSLCHVAPNSSSTPQH